MQELSGQTAKPHMDAILYSVGTGDVKPFPVGRSRDVAEDLGDAKRAGYSVAVPVVRTANAARKSITIEAQTGGVARVEKLLRYKRKAGVETVPVHMLASEYDRLSAKEKAAMLDKVTPKLDPRDAKIAELEAQLAAKAVKS